MREQLMRNTVTTFREGDKLVTESRYWDDVRQKYVDERVEFIIVDAVRERDALREEELANRRFTSASSSAKEDAVVPSQATASSPPDFASSHSQNGGVVECAPGSSPSEVVQSA